MKSLGMLCLILLYTFGALGQMPKKSPILPLMDDLPHIMCDTCQRAAKFLYKTIKTKKEEIKPKKLSEEEIISVVEKACDPESEDGNWLVKLDIVENDLGIHLVEHKNEGRCKEECKTISRACHDSVGDIDTDIAELLWKNSLKLSPFINEVCYNLNDVCTKRKPKFKKGKRKDFKFFEMSEQEKEAMKMKRQMSGIPGMPGMEMYSRDDLESMKESMKEQYGIKEEEDTPATPQPKQQESPPYKTKLGFFDMVKAAGADLFNKVKKLFGYTSETKNEL